METAKKYLRQIRDGERTIITLKERCDTLRFSLGASAIRYDKDKVQTTPHDAMSETMAEVFEIEDRMTEIQHILTDRRCEAERIINHIPDDIQQAALRLYYLDPALYSWGKVAYLIGKSEKYLIRRIHPDALASFEQARKIV